MVSIIDGAPSTLFEGRRAGARPAELTGNLPAACAAQSTGPAVSGVHASSFAAEVALLERAERAIRAGEGALALVFLDELEQKFPASSLGEERAAARVLAACEQAPSLSVLNVLDCPALADDLNPVLTDVSLGSLTTVDTLEITNNPVLDASLFDPVRTFERISFGNASAAAP